jgi:hypothetical protein
MASERLDAFIMQAGYGGGNPAINTFHFATPYEFTREKAAAAIVAFLQLVTPGGNCTVQKIMYTPSGGTGGTPIPFPDVEYDTLKAGNDDLLAMDDYGVEFGSGALAPVGSGITLNLYSATAGRHGTGRLYTAWTAASAFDAQGYVKTAVRSAVVTHYKHYIIGGSIYGSTPPNHPVVHSATTGDHEIIAATASQKPCRLKTRTR